MTRLLLAVLCLTSACITAKTTLPDGFVSADHDGFVSDDSDGSTSHPSSDGGTTDGATPTPVYDGYGSVFVLLNRSIIASTTYVSTSVGATFYAAVPTNAGSNCSSTTIDGCTVYQCTGTSPVGTTPPEVAAGTITVAGAGQSLSVHSETGSHETVSTQSLYWGGGESLSISSTGATIGAFTETLVVPTQIEVTAPYLPDSGAVPITRSLGLALKWMGGGAGEVVFSLARGNTTSSTSATCRFPASQSQASMSSAVLSMFPSGTASFSAYVESRKEKTVGTWLVSSWAYFNAVYDTGRTVAGQLQLD